METVEILPIKKKKEKFKLTNVMLFNRSYSAWIDLLIAEVYVMFAISMFNNSTSYLFFFLGGVFFSFWF
jgi:hypothetical protein